MKPKTQYTKSGRINIAYQVFGSGDRDLVYIPGWVSNIDLMWACPSLVQFLTELSKLVRVILFDKRGTGLSDRVSDLSPLEERMDDIRAVMDAVGSEKAFLFGHSEGGSVSALFAATYPERTMGLITFGMFAKRRWSEDYPWAPTDEERQEVYDMIENHWGGGEMNLATLAPSMKDDKQFMDWLASYFRSGASPNAALALTKMNTQIDIRDILDSIAVPTLLLYRTNDIDVKIEEGKYMQENISGSIFIEFPGDDHLFWAGDSGAVINEMVSFITSDFEQLVYDKVLSTLLKIEVSYSIASSIISNNYNAETNFDEFLLAKISQYRGRLIHKENNIITATFSGPSKAVHCAMEILKAGHLYDLQIAQALHIGEIRIIENVHPRGLASEIVHKLLQYASAGEILITDTINNLLSGTGLDFDEYGVLNISESRRLKILLLKDIILIDDINNIKPQEFHLTSISNQNPSFLESVMTCIEENLMNQNFSIETLSNDLYMSKRHLQRKIKSITNKSPSILIRSFRLHKAKELMIKDPKIIKDVAFLTGFGSFSYFSKCFKIEFGLSPTEFVSNILVEQ